MAGISTPALNRIPKASLTVSAGRAISASAERHGRRLHASSCLACHCMLVYSAAATRSMASNALPMPVHACSLGLEIALIDVIVCSVACRRHALGSMTCVCGGGGGGGGGGGQQKDSQQALTEARSSRKAPCIDHEKAVDGLAWALLQETCLGVKIMRW